MLDWGDAKGWTKTEFSMDFKSDVEARVFIHDELKNKDTGDETSSDNFIFEKGEKITDLGKTRPLRSIDYLLVIDKRIPALKQAQPNINKKLQL